MIPCINNSLTFTEATPHKTLALLTDQTNIISCSVQWCCQRSSVKPHSYPSAVIHWWNHVNKLNTVTGCKYRHCVVRQLTPQLQQSDPTTDQHSALQMSLQNIDKIPELPLPTLSPNVTMWTKLQNTTLFCNGWSPPLATVLSWQPSTRISCTHSVGTHRK